MTSTKRRVFVKIKSVLRALPQPIEAIAAAVGRLFSPSDDNYPKTGVQPFSGDTPDEHLHSP
ncbi:MAG: hypothetical protein ACOYM4_17990 [Nodosilinea sp.]|jgi:hypothetical protein